MSGQTGGISSLPTDPKEFDKDDRISFSKLDGKHIAVLDDGAEFEFDVSLKRWILLADESDDALIEEYQKNYGGPDADSGQSVPAQGKKRKNDQSNDREDGNGRYKNGKRQATRQPQPKQNTAVYVTGLPLDVTVDEVAELFSRKCGVIAEEIDSGRPRIKLYTDAQGNFKGDALVVFFKPQSVDMAIMLLDDTHFRMSPSGLGTGTMRVQAADLSFKKTYQEGNKEGGDSNSGEGSTSTQPSKSKGNGGKRNDDKAKVIKKTQKLDARLADWDDDEPPPALSALIPPAKGGKWDKVVILSHMFTQEELEEDPAALLEIKEDIREECAKLGEVTNVVLYDQEEDGIVSVRFKTVEAAEACVHLMHGRSFAGRTVEAFFATGKERFKRSKKDQGEDDEEE